MAERAPGNGRCTCGAGALKTTNTAEGDLGACGSCGRIWDRKGAQRFEATVVIRNKEVEVLYSCAAECGQSPKEWIATAVCKALREQGLLGAKWKKNPEATGENASR